MKKLLLSLALVAFAVAVQAGDAKDTKTKASTSTTKAEAKAECTADKKDSCCTGACKSEVKKQVTQVLLSPKDAANKKA